MADFFGYEIKEFSESTHTAQEAAVAIGCQLSQIAKSIVFRSGEVVVIVICNGADRVNVEKVESQTRLKLEKAEANWIKEKTGYSIGGIPPFGHKTKCKIFFDKKLLEHEWVWPAAGHPNKVFRIKSRELLVKSGAEVVEVGI